MIRTSSVVHTEAWTYPQEERDSAELIADIWREQGRTVTLEEDTQNITVASVSMYLYEIDDGDKEMIHDGHEEATPGPCPE